MVAEVLLEVLSSLRYHDPYVLPDLMDNIVPAQLDRVTTQIDCYVVPGKGGRGGKVHVRAGCETTCTELNI